MRTAEEILRKGTQASGLYFDNNGNRMMLISEAEKAINEARKEVDVMMHKELKVKRSVATMNHKDKPMTPKQILTELKQRVDTIPPPYNMFGNICAIKQGLEDLEKLLKEKENDFIRHHHTTGARERNY